MLLEIKGLTKNFAGLTAVSDLDQSDQVIAGFKTVGKKKFMKEFFDEGPVGKDLLFSLFDLGQKGTYKGRLFCLDVTNFIIFYSKMIEFFPFR